MLFERHALLTAHYLLAAETSDTRFVFGAVSDMADWAGAGNLSFSPTNTWVVCFPLTDWSALTVQLCCCAISVRVSPAVTT